MISKEIESKTSFQDLHDLTDSKKSLKWKFQCERPSQRKWETHTVAKQNIENIGARIAPRYEYFESLGQCQNKNNGIKHEYQDALCCTDFETDDFISNVDTFLSGTYTWARMIHLSNQNRELTAYLRFILPREKSQAPNFDKGDGLMKYCVGRNWSI